MNAQPNPEAELVTRRGLVAQLFAADRGKKLDDDTAAAYLLSLRRMDTPRLARVVERMLEGLEHDADPYRVPSPSRIWQLAKELRLGSTPAPRTAPPLELHGTPEQSFDGWDANANILLLAYVTDPVSRRAARISPDSSTDHHASLRIGPETHARTAILVRWKNAWASEMREDREMRGGQLDGRKLWAEYMAEAEREIGQRVARAA